MNLSGRERRLVIALGVVILAGAVWLLFLRPSGSAEVDLTELFPPASPTAVAPPAASTASPTFVIPVGARDPFSK